MDMEKQQARKLKRRSKIFAGDEIQTGPGAKVQLKFKDKGVIALQENTSLQITEFAYSGHEGTEEKSFFKLVKGSFRAISGAIGKQNPEDYRVETPLATIGIRGTHYRADLGSRLGVQVLNGAVEVRNSAGSITVGDGFEFRNAVVNGPGQLPLGMMNPVDVLQTNSLPGKKNDKKSGDSRQMAGKESDRGNMKELEAETDDGSVMHTMMGAKQELLGEMHDADRDMTKELEQERKNESSNDEQRNIQDKLVQNSEEKIENSDILANGETAADHDGDNDAGDTGNIIPSITDPRLSDAEIEEISSNNIWGVASVDNQPDETDSSATLIGGLARDGNSALPGIFVDKGMAPSEANFDSTDIARVLRQGTHSEDQSAFARFDTNIDTTQSNFAWGHWSGGNARLFTNSADSTDFTPINSDIYWFTAQPTDAATFPTSGEVRFDQTFFLAGNGSAGPILDDEPAAISIGFTLNWVDSTFNDGEIKIVNGVSGDKAQQVFWKFYSLTGTLSNSAEETTPVLQFYESLVGEVCLADCVTTGVALGEIETFILNGNDQLAGHFTFWEDGNTSQWVSGIFAVGEDQRTKVDQPTLDHSFIGVYHASPFASGAPTQSPLLGGYSETPSDGDFYMVDNLEGNYGAVVQLGDGVVEAGNPGGSGDIHGHSLTWGAWNGSNLNTDFSSTTSDFVNETYTWVVYTPINAALMEAGTGQNQVSFSLPNMFYGWQHDPDSGSKIPLQLDRGYLNVDLTNSDLEGKLIFDGLGRFDIGFTGTTSGNGIAVESTTAFYNGASVNVSLHGQYLGSTLADGLVGGFNVGNPGDLDIYATGVYGFGRDERISSADIPSYRHTAFMSFDTTDSGGVAVSTGIATQPNSGIFSFRSFSTSGSKLLDPLVSTPMFNSAMIGTIPVDWGAWDDVAGSATVAEDPLNPSTKTPITDAVAWVVGTPSDPTDIPTTGITAYNTLVGFVGYESGLPLTPTSMTMSVDFASQSFSANLQASASVNQWDMTYNGVLSGNKLSGVGSGSWDDGISTPEAASGVIEAALVGTGNGGSGPEGVIGAFKNQVNSDSSIHSSGVFVLQQ